MKAQDYKYIRLWGLRSGSYDYYITAQQQLAEKDNAPANAIYKRYNSEEWATAEGNLKAELDKLEENYRGR